MNQLPQSNINQAIKWYRYTLRNNKLTRVANKNAPKGNGKGNNSKSGSKKSGSGNASFPTSAGANAKNRHKGRGKNTNVQPKEQVKAKENAKVQEAKGSKGKVCLRSRISGGRSGEWMLANTIADLEGQEQERQEAEGR